MWKDSWCVGLEEEGVACGWGELSEIPLKEVKQKIGEGKQTLEKGRGRAESRVACLKKGR